MNRYLGAFLLGGLIATAQNAVAEEFWQGGLIATAQNAVAEEKNGGLIETAQNAVAEEKSGGLIATAQNAVAEEKNGELIATAHNAVAEEKKGNLHLFPSLAWATLLPEEQLGDRRGGIGGLAFSVFFEGSLDNLGNLQGFLNVNPGSAILGTPTVTTTGTQATVTATLGNFQGGSGIFQLTQVPGSFNVVNNTLVVQIALITVGSTSQIPTNPLTLFGTSH